MTPDDMANYHEHMARWCREKAEESGPPYVSSLGTPHQVVNAIHQKLLLSAMEHDEAFQYWCNQRPR